MLMNHRFRTSILTFILITSTIFVSGCWDRKEIDNRGFVLGVAIDHATSPEPKGQYDLPHVTEEADGRKYRVTFQFPRFAKGEGEEKGSGTETHLVLTGEGESMAAISSAMGARVPYDIFFEDIQLLVFSESVAREGISDLLDFFIRNPSMRRRVKLLVTPGQAEDILKNKMQAKEISSTFIAKVTRNVKTVPRFASKTDLGDISEAIHNNYSFFMPMIIMEKGDVKLTKAALFNKEAKLVGELNEYEIVGAKILRLALKDGFFSLSNPAKPEKLVVFELLEPTAEINSYVEGDKLWFTLDATYVGNLAENTETKQDALNPVFLKAVEKGFADQFTRQVEAAYYKQQKVKADISDLGWLVYRQHPQYWKKIKDRWDDEVFPTVPLEVNIKVIVRRPGMTN